MSHARQDIAFFDANKTGQLVSRLTTDVQEFKSSFKLVISQVSGPVAPPHPHTHFPTWTRQASPACPSPDVGLTGAR